MATLDPARVRLGRIRCLVSAVECMKRGEQLPFAICFVPAQVPFEYQGEEPLNVTSEPSGDAKVVCRLPEGKKSKFVCTGLPLFNSLGGWMRVKSPQEGWVLLQPQKLTKGKIKRVENEECQPTEWLKAVERSYALQIIKPQPLTNCDEESIAKLQSSPPGWNLEADEELAQFMNKVVLSAETIGVQMDGNTYFTKVTASSEEDEVKSLFQPDTETYWESDGTQGSHWLSFHVKPGVIIEKFSILVDPDDGSYLPRRVVVKAGPKGHLSLLHTHTFGMSDFEMRELQLVPFPMDSYKEVIEVHIKSCFQGGIDTRIHGVKVTTRTSETLIAESDSLFKEVFTPDRISRYPKLQPFQLEELFYRALMIKRVAFLLDQDLTYLLPRWRDLSGAFDAITTIRQLWPLSQKRQVIIQDMLSQTVSPSPSRPVIFLNRVAANIHREDPSLDADCKNTVFNQLMKELKKHTKPLSYNFRWAGHWCQWWECKFIQEGAIDQGGGFRDSIAEVAEELCPSKPNSEVALPLFVRSPNQSQDSSNVYRDVYTPNPGCIQLNKYQFVGQLMGAMFRSQESLVLPLSQFVWKQLIGEQVTWTRDFVSVDSAEVKLIDSIETMSREKFDAAFADSLNYTVVLSNGETVPLLANGEEKLVSYDERLEYCRLVKEKRMHESRAQIEVIRQGLVKVVPPDTLSLLTWRELELRVCGNPEISIESLKQSTRYDTGISENSPRVKLMWQALEKFSNEDRSHFLRFITGRRRLPCTIFIDVGEVGSTLPSSATCSNTLYLPKYDSVEQAVDRLKYAAYNCIAIDTDMSPWE